jgi:hypothetical protein
MAGYSSTPLAKKLGIRPGGRVALVCAPAGFTLDDLPDGATLVADGPADVAVVFATRAADLVPAVHAVRERLGPAGALWMAWPKKASKVPTDITEDRLRELWLPTGLVDNKVCAIDEVWSGLRFVLRVALR